MPLTESAAATVSVGEVAAMNDVELAQFMQRHRLPDGDYDLPIDGWDKLSKDERSHLAQRLETQKDSLAQSPTACSRPLDLDDLNARLRQVSPNNSFSRRPESPIIDRLRSPTPPFDPTRREIEAYHQLINEGGRPSYSINLIHDVYRDPDNYAEMLRPWQEYLTPVSPSGIFRRQLQRWRDFCKWQNDNRDREDDDGGFPASRDKRLAEIEADPSCLKSRWEDIQWERERQRYHCRERGCRGFRDYAEAVKRRLARHGFTLTFELDEDPKKQDKLTTWIEYLNYEYWWLDKYATDIERLEPEHDKLWQELVDKKILRPHETKEFVRTDASGMERETEKDQAMKAVQRAESEAKRIYVLTQEDPKRSHIPRAKRISMMKHGAENLFAAKQRSEQARRRSHLIVQFVRATFDYDEAKRNAVRHRVLAQWVLDQVSLIQAEMNPSEANRPGSDGKPEKGEV
ncbi:ankyrin protein unc44 [Fusarium mexicanum]|uniref:Ankyrin protein unc44 n=1 Tax=Fusarium mexicanum TaxID=751941 RepID=A0A8H5MJY2_9HYPO|nr:ankyrin protein unc44 [Fusarium mexicanum]